MADASPPGESGPSMLILGPALATGSTETALTAPSPSMQSLDIALISHVEPISSIGKP